MLATQTMLQLGIPLNRVLRRLRDVRQERYKLLRGFFPGVTDVEESDHEAAEAAHAGGERNAACIGKTVGASTSPAST
jgi:CPA2 family monovalent cation:H+ antiporter-2